MLSKALQDNAISLPSGVTEKLLCYLELIKTWNRVFNLTNITQMHDMIYLHLIDSLLVQPFLHGERLLDVGSGAGLPGIPLAIINPQQQWTLLDKNNKKTRFLTQVVAELGLPNVNVVHQRSEDFHPDACFDSILSRALGTLLMFLETTEHLLCANGKFIAMKGKLPQDEIHALPNRFKTTQVARIDLKGIEKLDRHIVCLQMNT